MSLNYSLFPELAEVISTERKVPVKRHMRRVAGQSDDTRGLNHNEPTSVAAIVRHTASGNRQSHRAQVLAALEVHPGSTAAELAQHVDFGMDGSGTVLECRRRLGDAAQRGLCHSDGERVCKVAGTGAKTWKVGEADA